MLLIATLLGAAALTATAGVRFGVSIGFPAPFVISTPVVYATSVASAPVTAVQTIPPCPGVGYVWTGGYWSNLPTGRVWVPGAWHYRSAYVTYVNGRHEARDGYGEYRRNDRHNGHDRDRDNRYNHDGDHR